MREEALRLYNKYCAADAVAEANISGETKIKLKRILDAEGDGISSLLFDPAKVRAINATTLLIF